MFFLFFMPNPLSPGDPMVKKKKTRKNGRGVPIQKARIPSYKLRYTGSTAPFMLSRLHFLGTLVLAATTEIHIPNSCTQHQERQQQQQPAIVMTNGPNYDAWESVLKAHIKPDTLRGIPVNSVDYNGEHYSPHSDSVVVGSVEGVTL